VPLGDVSLNFMAYTSEVSINPGYLQDFYLLQLPLQQSRARITTGAENFVSEQRIASLINPTDRTSMIWSQGCQQLMVQIRKSAVEQELSRLVRCELSRPLTFTSRISLDQNPRMASWWRYVQFLVADIDQGSFAGLSSAEKQNHKQTLISNLLHATAHNYSQLLEDGRCTVAPRQVKRAEAYMLENLSHAITIDDLVAASGASARSLFEAFRRYRGLTPMKRLQQLRVEAAHRELLSADADETVTDILTRLGISQLGRFAGLYKQSYGENPSQTLRRH
jgi:AraC-like DNA-binding protein